MDSITQVRGFTKISSVKDFKNLREGKLFHNYTMFSFSYLGER